MNADEETLPAPDGAEEARLDALRALQIAGTRPEKRFDRLTRLASDFFDVPMAAVSLIDSHRLWLKAAVGFDAVDNERSLPFCTQVVQDAEPLIVLDTHQDSRFANSPVVKGPPFIRFYAGAPLTTAAGHRLGALCIADTLPRTDFSAREQRALKAFAELVMNEMDQRRAELFRSSVIGFSNATELSLITIGGTGHIQTVNRAAAELFGYSRSQMIGQSVDILIPDPMKGAHRAGLTRIAAGGQSTLTGKTIEVTALRRDGTEFPIEMSLSVWNNDDGVGIGAVIRDISERRLRDARLMRQANHDTLTGLANRTRLEELLGETLTRSSQQTVLLLDLDGFKDVNDKHGHAVGDALLQAIAIRLPSALPAGTILARFGGDEFGVLLPDDEVEPTIAASMAAQAILEVFVKPFTIAGHLFQLGISIGAAFAPEHGQYPQELIASADFALFRAKQSGGRTYRMFEPGMRDELATQRALLDELLRGLHQGELELFYQPQVCLSDGRLVGVEALLRWRHPTRGLLRPGHFMGVLEGSPLSIPAGLWVLNEACRQLALWNAAGFKGIRMGVNVFPAQFRSGTFAKDVFDAIATHGVDNDCVEIEVTEGIVLEYNDIFLSDAKALHAAGIRIALDDFGTGFASLSALKKFPLTTLKIDRSFVIDLLTNPHDVAIARAMISMGEDLGLDTIAEGIETPDQEALLKNLGCRWGQGFLYGKAVSAAELDMMLAAQR